MPDVEVRPSAIHGRGAFATRDFRRGERILPIDDSRIVTADNPLDPSRGEYEHHCDWLGATVVYMQEPERYINLCCEPNAYVETVHGVRWVVAYRDIVAGDEITYDYCIDSFGDTIWGCHCGHPRCRKVHSADFFALPTHKLVEYLPLLNPWFVAWKRDEVEALCRRLAREGSSA